MEQTIKNIVSIIKTYGEIIKISISAIQISLVFYLMYKINRVRVEMLDSLENVNSKVESLDFNFIESINNNKFKESNEVILKMLELQSKTAASSHLPVINIVNESSTKPVVIGSLILIALTVSCIWWFGPKVLYITTTQIGKINLIVSELLRFIPGSNSAEATTFLTKLNLRVVTTIDKGIPYHRVITSDDVSYGLEEFLLKMPWYASKSVASVAENAPDITDFLTKSGVDLTGLIL
jgi:hypothetical protein